MDTPENSGGQTIATEACPGDPAVARAIQPAARAATREIPGLPARLPERGKNNLRVLGIETDIDRAGLLVLVQHLCPGFATVRRTEDTALRIRTEGMSQCGYQHDVRIVRIDDERADLTR